MTYQRHEAEAMTRSLSSGQPYICRGLLKNTRSEIWLAAACNFCHRHYCHWTQSASLSHWGKGMDFALLIHKEHVNKLFVYRNFNCTGCSTTKLWHLHNCCGVSLRIQLSADAMKVYGGKANKTTAKRCNMSPYGVTLNCLKRYQFNLTNNNGKLVNVQQNLSKKKIFEPSWTVRWNPRSNVIATIS